MHFRLRHLEVIEAVLRTGSTCAAADTLHVTQPVVSRTIKHAERRLGYELFRRYRGRLEPTPEAQALVPELNTFFAHWRKIQDYAENLAGREVVLRVAVNPALADVLPCAVVDVNRQMPGLRFQLLTLHTSEIVDQLLAGQIDIGISQSCASPEGIASEAIGRNELVLLIPRQWSTSGRLNASLMNDKPFIGVQHCQGLGAIIDDYLCRQGFAPVMVATVQTYRLAVSLVEQGLGATIVDRLTADTADDNLVQRLPLLDAPNFLVHALYHPRHIPGKAERMLREGIARMLSGNGRELYQHVS
jgi:DNA-binding transcriptional LysR family regulator